VTDVDDFLRLIARHARSDTATGELRCGYQATVASHGGQAPNDLDLDRSLHNIVAIWLLGFPGPKTIIGKDRVASCKSGIDIRVRLGLHFSIPVSVGEQVSFQFSAPSVRDRERVSLPAVKANPMRRNLQNLSLATTCRHAKLGIYGQDFVHGNCANNSFGSAPC
jgi:hypothetical protein